MTLTQTATPTHFSDIFPETEMGRLCRAKDWSATPLGAPDSWPVSLRTTSAMVLRQVLPQALCWGPSLLQIYNDGYRVILGDKHPGALGTPVLETWSEISGDIAPLFASVTRGETVYFEDLHLRVKRHGQTEDAWFTFSYSPIIVESGEVGAVLVNCIETTAQVEGRLAQFERDALLEELTSERARLEESNMLLQHQADELEHRATALRLATLALEERTTQAESARASAEHARRDAEEAREAAEFANRAKSEFLAVMSHELRTPLNAIGGYTELVELGIHGPVTPEQAKALARVQQSQRHLLGLINGVLNYSRVEVGAVQYAVEAVSMDDVLKTCEALLAPQAHAKGIALSFSGCASSVVAAADREKVSQIVLNLLTNAVKFTDRSGSVTLTCEAADGMVRAEVTDTGRGIPADQLERVFQPFVQVDAKLTRTNEGTGLGLAISRQLAQGMHGDLTVSSTPRVGSTFTLSLPQFG